jgi:hypothetical protein
MKTFLQQKTDLLGPVQNHLQGDFIVPRPPADIVLAFFTWL